MPVISEIPNFQRERVADMVYGVLRRAIVRHELPPGTHLSVPALTQQFGVSRTPVREAVQRIVLEGLATESPHRGAFVIEFKLPELEPLYEVRQALEVLAARLAAKRAQPEDVVRLQEILEVQERALGEDDIERHVATDIGFHAAMLATARNPALTDMLEQVYERIRSAMLIRVSPTGPRLALEDHRAILQAVADHDPDAAACAAQLHIDRALARLAAGHEERSEHAAPEATSAS